MYRNETQKKGCAADKIKKAMVIQTYFKAFVSINFSEVQKMYCREMLGLRNTKTKMNVNSHGKHANIAPQQVTEHTNPLNFSKEKYFKYVQVLWWNN